MKILEFPNKARAWCLDRQGNEYPCWVHPFGSLDSDAIEDAAWLYASNIKPIKPNCLEYLCKSFIIDYPIDDCYTFEDFQQAVRESLAEIECLRGYASTNALADDVIKKCFQYIEENLSINISEVESLGSQIKSYLNNNFLRVRYGSEYQTVLERRGALYFRISSNGFDWSDVILDFVLRHCDALRLQSITVERDLQSTGSADVHMDHLPLDEFLMKKHMVLESIRTCSN